MSLIYVLLGLLGDWVFLNLNKFNFSHQDEGYVGPSLFWTNNSFTSQIQGKKLQTSSQIFCTLLRFINLIHFRFHENLCMAHLVHHAKFYFHFNWASKSPGQGKQLPTLLEVFAHPSCWMNLIASEIEFWPMWGHDGRNSELWSGPDNLYQETQP